MHGVMYWSSKSPESVCSRLITWQDRRCSAGFLSSLPPSSPYALSAGYGCATTAWLAREGPEKGFLDAFDRAGNVMDFVGEEITYNMFLCPTVFGYFISFFVHFLYVN